MTGAQTLPLGLVFDWRIDDIAAAILRDALIAYRASMTHNLLAGVISADEHVQRLDAAEVLSQSLYAARCGKEAPPT